MANVLHLLAVTHGAVLRGRCTQFEAADGVREDAYVGSLKDWCPSVPLYPTYAIATATGLMIDHISGFVPISKPLAHNHTPE